MDTRNKIIPPDRAAALAGELRASGAVFALVLDPPQPLLSNRARAELVAALGVIDYVVPAEEQAARELLSHFHPGEIVGEESADLLRASRLTEHVQRRHQQ